MFLDDRNDAEFVCRNFMIWFLQSLAQTIHVGPRVQLQSRMIAH